MLMLVILPEDTSPMVSGFVGEEEEEAEDDAEEEEEEEEEPEVAGSMSPSMQALMCMLPEPCVAT